MSASTIAGMAKRGYSREFKPHGDTGKRYLLDNIPAGLWRDVQVKCKREGVSIRAQMLTLLQQWARSSTEGGGTTP
jgi:hypothetical protein